MKRIGQRYQLKPLTTLFSFDTDQWTHTATTLLSRCAEHGLRVISPGYTSVKLEQLAAFQSVLRKEDVFVSIPTGIGKCLMHQILPI